MGTNTGGVVAMMLPISSSKNLEHTKRNEMRPSIATMAPTTTTGDDDAKTNDDGNDVDDDEYGDNEKADNKN